MLSMVRVSSCFFFFFSSRRRHTRFDCDWSSDVCSSDLRYFDPCDHLECDRRVFEDRVAVCDYVHPGRHHRRGVDERRHRRRSFHRVGRSEEHTSELQSQSNLVCRLLLEKKKTSIRYTTNCCRSTFLSCRSQRLALKSTLTAVIPRHMCRLIAVLPRLEVVPSPLHTLNDS